ncbi:MAG: SMI1/KNR4 family protein [Zoogloeaceae bacterium]|nr:SMI1/KNR4 family protein [Zoogloeaceae bacterium]
MNQKSRVIGTTIEAIRAAETDLGRALPPSFADWLLANNSKCVEDVTIFPVFDAREPRKTWDSIVRHFNEEWQEWQKNFSGTSLDFSQLLPFGEFGTGDYYCFDYANPAGDGEIGVVLWSHETGETSLVADNFLEFVERLENGEIDDLA